MSSLNSATYNRGRAAWAARSQDSGPSREAGRARDRRAGEPVGSERPRSTRAKAAASGFEAKVRSIPARFMSPAALLVAVTAVLVIFGLVMIFSASSIEAASETGDSTYYLWHQGLYAFFGLVFASGVALVDYHKVCSDIGMAVVSLLAILSLGAVLALGTSALGAKRWIDLGLFTLQPSEFAKLAILFVTSKLFNDCFSDQSRGLGQTIVLGVIYIGLPLGLILAEPDKGTTVIIAAMVFGLLFISGFRRDILIKIIFGVFVAGFIWALKDDYSRQRISSYLSSLLSFRIDSQGSDYQILQGYIGFGTGGVFGRGLGMSRQKYSFLPEAHTDFIFAVVGEELGLAGTLFVIVLFGLIAHFGLKIAHNSHDLTGRLIATGAVTLLLASFFINVCSVLGIIPLTGKPLPFLTYGGSSLISSMGLIGAVVNVAIHSKLPETEHDRRRRQISLVADEETGVGEAYARGSAESRAMRANERANVPLAGGASAAQGGGFKLVDGGSRRGQEPGAREAREGRGGYGSQRDSGAYADARRQTTGGRTRIDLGPTGAERLRPNSGPTVRGTNAKDDGRGSRPRRRS